jgi:hypothetical protein
MAKTEATAKLESITVLPSIGSKVTVYFPSALSSFVHGFSSDAALCTTPLFLRFLKMISSA